MPLHAHIHEQHLARHVDLIRPLLNHDVTITTGSNIPPDTEFLVTEHCPADQLDLLSSLKWILLPCAGVSTPMRSILQSRPHISAHNLHYNDVSVAENAIALLMAASKRILPLDQCLRRGHWTQSSIDTQHAMLSGSKCMLLGYGAIGQKIAPILEALGIEVNVMKRTPCDTLAYPCYTTENWKSQLSETDILLSALPATPETHHIIDQDAIDTLPGHALFINVGRGDNVDEEALYHALKSGKIGAAGLDVWWNYPVTYPYLPDDDAEPCYPSKYPYQDLENVVMLPHRGADHRMKQLKQRLQHMLAERINQAAQGEKLPSQIDPLRGY